MKRLVKLVELAEKSGDNFEASAKQRAEIITGLGGSFDFMMELHTELTPLITQYERLAGQSFAEPQRDVLNPPGAAANPGG